MSAMPAYSVVMPLWNKEREVGRSIASVLAQRHSNFELLVVNDGSTDASRAVVEAFCDPRVRMIEQPNAGVSAARNTGVQHAASNLVGFLDADDEWCPEFLDRITALVLENPGAAVFATGLWIDRGDGHRVQVPVAGVPRGFRGFVPDFFRTAGVLSSSSVVVRREALSAVGGFREGLAFGEDLDLWLRLGSRFCIAFDDRPAAVWHRGASNRACDRESGESTGALRSSLRAIENAPDVTPDVKRAARAHVARIELGQIERLLAMGNARTARRLLADWACNFPQTARSRALFAASLLPNVMLAAVARGGACARQLTHRLRHAVG